MMTMRFAALMTAAALVMSCLATCTSYFNGGGFILAWNLLAVAICAGASIVAAVSGCCLLSFKILLAIFFY